MSRVAFATCSPRRTMWDDDLPAAEVLREAGVETDFVAWDDPEADWQSYERVVIRSTWDYGERLDEFLAWADSVGERLRNLPVTVRWNSDKRYLAELAGAGLPVPPTLLVAPGGPVPEIEFEVVIKPVTGAGARDTGRFTPDGAAGATELFERLASQDEVAMVQPYYPEIEQAGETAIVVLGGNPAYVLNKKAFLPEDSVAPPDDTGVAEAMSDPGLVSLAEAQPQELALAEKTMTWIGARFGRMPLQARVDMLRTRSGEPVLMEVELIEPCLYASLATGLEMPGAEAFAAALIADLG
jgi:glutathione synthase/RimK-type ligase-like ATP-grasp enzyme